MIKCAYCGKQRELRPYGKNGAEICHDCGFLPENKAETERQFLARLAVAEQKSPSGVAAIGRSTGPMPAEDLILNASETAVVIKKRGKRR